MEHERCTTAQCAEKFQRRSIETERHKLQQAIITADACFLDHRRNCVDHPTMWNNHPFRLSSRTGGIRSSRSAYRQDGCVADCGQAWLQSVANRHPT